MWGAQMDSSYSYLSIYINQDAKNWKDCIVIHKTMFESEVPSVVTLKSLRLEKEPALVVTGSQPCVEKFVDEIKSLDIKEKLGKTDLSNILKKVEELVAKNKCSIVYRQNYPKSATANKLENEQKYQLDIPEFGKTTIYLGAYTNPVNIQDEKDKNIIIRGIAKILAKKLGKIDYAEAQGIFNRNEYKLEVQANARIDGFLPEKLIMCDLEMTGVVPKRDDILQIAMLKLKLESNQYIKVEEPLVVYLKHDGSPSNDFQKEFLTHIFEKCNKSDVVAEDAKKQINKWLGEWRGKVSLTGDCVPTDFAFLTEKGIADVSDIDNPGSFHYEFFEINPIKLIARHLLGEKEKLELDPGIHDALVDCENQLKELNYYLDILCKNKTTASFYSKLVEEKQKNISVGQKFIYKDVNSSHQEKQKEGVKKIYLDMDGVLSDFDAMLHKHSPKLKEKYGDINNNPIPDDILWPTIEAIPDFWANMPMMKDAKKLLSFVEGLGIDIEILTAPSSSDKRCKPGKLEWLEKYGIKYKVNFCRAEEKKKLATPNSILIDDRMDNILGWVENNGIGILHFSADDTIDRLKQFIEIKKDTVEGKSEVWNPNPKTGTNTRYQLVKKPSYDKTAADVEKLTEKEEAESTLKKCSEKYKKPGRPYCIYKHGAPFGDQPKGWPKTYETKEDGKKALKMMHIFGSSKFGDYILTHKTTHVSGHEIDYFQVFAHLNSMDVGHATFVPMLKNNKKVLVPEFVEVDIEHRGNGLATAMYKYAENITKAKVIPSDSLTPDAKRMWKRIITSKNDSFKFIKKSDVTAGISPVLYHLTSLEKISKILEEDKLRLITDRGTISDKGKGEKWFYFSTSRSLGNRYQKFIGALQGLLVMDGIKFSEKYSGGPVDYWQAGPEQSESEDRIWSKEPEISNAAKYIKEIHLFIPPKHNWDEKSFWRDQLRSTLIKGKQKNIPIFVYNNEDDFRVLNSKNAIDPMSLPLSGGEKVEPWLRGKSRDFAEILELLQKPKNETLTKKASRKLDDIERYDDQAKVIDSWIHNRRSTHDPELLKLLKLMQKLNIKDSKSIVDFVREKYKEVSVTSKLNVDFHTIMLDLKDCKPANGLKEFSKIQNLIKPEDIFETHPYKTHAPNGLEVEPHVTVLFGLKNEEDIEPIKGYCAELPPLNFKIGNISIFSSEDKPYDVLKLEIVCPEMEKLHYWIRSNFENGCTFPFNGHMTLSYIKKGACKDLEGMCWWSGAEYSADKLLFSHKDSGISNIPLSSIVTSAKKTKKFIYKTLSSDEKKFKWTRKKTDEGFDINVTTIKDGSEVGSIIVEFMYVNEEEFTPYEGEPFYADLMATEMMVNIVSLEVNEKFQGQGVAKYILNLAIDEIKKRYSGYPVFINASPTGSHGINLDDLIKFYQRAGFKVLKKYPKFKNAALFVKDASKMKSVAKTRSWRGHEVDDELKDEWLTTLNKLPNMKISSVCSGHKSGSGGLGGGHYPGFDADHKVLAARKLSVDYALEIANSIIQKLNSAPNTKADVTITTRYGTPYINGSKNEKFYSTYSKKMPPVDGIVFHVSSTIRNSGKNQEELVKWWESILPVAKRAFSGLVEAPPPIKASYQNRIYKDVDAGGYYYDKAYINPYGIIPFQNLNFEYDDRMFKKIDTDDQDNEPIDNKIFIKKAEYVWDNSGVMLPPGFTSIAANMFSVKKVDLSHIAKLAQEVYDNWDADADEDGDFEVGFGGICHLIADKISGYLNSIGIEATTVSAQVGEQHVYTVAKFKEGVYEVDISPSVYETGSGYNWKKKKDVKFDRSDIIISRLSPDPNEFESYVEGSVVTADIKSDTYKLIDKYIAMFGHEIPRPVIKIKDNLGSRWLGQCVFNYDNNSTSVINLQKSIFDDPNTLERIVAHEMVHHLDYMLNKEEKMKYRGSKYKPNGHGSFFREWAQVINSKMGKDFVTETSDESYVQKTERTFLILIMPLKHSDHLCYTWAVNPSEKQKKQIEKVIGLGGKLIKTSDIKFTHGPKINSGKIAVPESKETQSLLRELFEKGESTITSAIINVSDENLFVNTVKKEFESKSRTLGMLIKNFRRQGDPSLVLVPLLKKIEEKAQNKFRPELSLKQLIQLVIQKNKEYETKSSYDSQFEQMFNDWANGLNKDFQAISKKYPWFEISDLTIMIQGFQDNVQKLFPAKEVTSGNRIYKIINAGELGDWEKEGYRLHVLEMTKDDIDVMVLLTSVFKNVPFYIKPKDDDEFSINVILDNPKSWDEYLPELKSGEYVKDTSYKYPVAYAIDKSGKPASIMVVANGECILRETLPAHRRKGLSIGLHSLLEKNNGRKINKGVLSEDGKLFWDGVKQKSEATTSLLKNAWDEYTSLFNENHYYGYRKPSESAYKELEQEYEWPKCEIIYRAIRADSQEEIDFNKLGVYWTNVRDMASPYWGDKDKSLYVIKAKIKPNTIDWLGLVEANMKMVYGGEQEVKLLSNSELEVLDVEVYKDKGFVSEKPKTNKAHATIAAAGGIEWQEVYKEYTRIEREKYDGLGEGHWPEEALKYAGMPLSPDVFEKYEWERAKIPLSSIYYGKTDKWKPSEPLMTEGYNKTANNEWDLERYEQITNEEESDDEETRRNNKKFLDLWADEIQAIYYSEMSGQPPPVIVIAEGNKYRLLNGRHRCRAAFLNGKTEIDAFIGITVDDNDGGSKAYIYTSKLSWPTEEDMDDAWEVLKVAYSIHAALNDVDYDNFDSMHEELYENWMKSVNKAKMKSWKIKDAKKKFRITDHDRRIGKKQLNNPIIVGIVEGQYHVLDGNHRFLTKIEKGDETIDCLMIPMDWAIELNDADTKVVASADVNDADNLKEKGDELAKSFNLELELTVDDSEELTIDRIKSLTPGDGRKFLKEFTKLADEFPKVHVYLNAMPLSNDKRMSLEKLVSLYEEFGFKKTGVDEESGCIIMVRRPKVRTTQITSKFFYIEDNLNLVLDFHSAETDTWVIKRDDKNKLGEVSIYLTYPTGPSINDIRIDKELRNKGIGRSIVKLLVKHYGSLSSDPQGNTSPDAIKMWQSVNAEKIPTGKNTKGFIYLLKKSMVNSALAGLKGDWKKEDYKIIYDGFDEDAKNREGVAGYVFHIEHPKYGNVGQVVFTINPKTGNLNPIPYIDEKHRRKGLATEIYKKAEKELGLKVEIGSKQTPDAKKLWESFSNNIKGDYTLVLASWPKKLTTEQLVQYYADTTTELGLDKEYFLQRWEKYDAWELKDVPVDNISSHRGESSLPDASSKQRIEKLKNADPALIPPIIIELDKYAEEEHSNKKYQTRDGHHRLEAAKAAGRKTIQAYVPHEKWKSFGGEVCAKWNSGFKVNDIVKQLKTAGRDLGDDEDFAYEAQEIIDFIESFPPKITVYRTIHLESGEKIDLVKIGNHWTYSKEKAIEFARNNLERPYTLIRATVDRSKVDWGQTLFQNIHHPHEEELFIFGKPFKDVKVAKLK